MIPIRLSVRNFMCYRGEAATLDLTGVQLACLSGENGSGKSALLGAITWALWGKARERVSDDDLISQGTTEMEVEYEFALGDAQYRVVRKRSRKGSSGTTILELHMLSDEGSGTGDQGSEPGANKGNTDTQHPTSNTRAWRPMTGHNVRDTQARIIELLKMEYDTFINSAFILQGRADEFTVKDPADRKRVLADILGLDEYGRLEERAKEEAKERKALMTNLEGRMESIDRELLRRPEYTQELETVEAELIERQAELVSGKGEYDVLQERWRELRAHLQRLDELRERVDRHKVGIDGAQTRVYANKARASELEALLARREEIERGYADLLAAQREESRFVESLSALRALENERAEHEKAISSELAGLQSDLKNQERRIAEIERSLAGRSVLERQLAEAMEKARKLELLAAQAEDTRCSAENLDAKLHIVTEQIGAIEKEGKSLREKLNMVKATHADGKGHADCPLCGTPLGAEALARVQRSYQDDIDAKLEEHEQKRKEQKAIHDELVGTRNRYDKEREQLKELPVHQKHRSDYESRLQLLDKEQEKLDKEQGVLATLRTQVKAEDYAHEHRAALAQVQAEVEALAYSKEAHEAASLRARELQSYNDRYHKLEGAENELAQVHSSIKADAANVANWEKEQERDRAEIATLEPQVDGVGSGSQINEVEALMSDKKANVDDLEGQVADLTGRRGDLRGKIDYCDALQVEKSELAARYKTATEEKSVYDDLTVAFGKKGIQAMIIENVLPELEDEANKLLGRMSDGRMSVQFATQRDARSTKSVIETLDINISDEMGTRPYELYSGGEAFRANFAVRIALSKLLTRRAGAQLQLLVVDEGFGTQDGQGRDRLVSAIRSIQEDFEKILVVTHIEELKGEFPVRIDVVKTESGSYITMDDGRWTMDDS